MKTKFRPVLSIRIFGEEKCFGPGVAQLLRRVQEHGSLRAAAGSMGMAYSKAWKVIKNAETILGFPLLLSSTGGKHGGGATLSCKAFELLSAYERYCAELNDYAAQQFPACFGGLLYENERE